jgi:hypothetical protein
MGHKETIRDMHVMSMSLNDNVMIRQSYESYIV